MPPAYTYYFVAATPSNGIKKTDVTRWLLFDYIHCILCPLLYYIGVAGSSPLNYSLIGKRSWNAQTVKKVPSSRHGARPQGRVHGSALNFVPRDCEAEARPADETAEAQRKRGAACGRNSRAGVGAAVQIYERATTRDGNLANSNKRGSGLPFASPLRRAQQKQGTATTRGKGFLTRDCGQKWVPPKACRFCDTLTPALWGGRFWL